MSALPSVPTSAVSTDPTPDPDQLRLQRGEAIAELCLIRRDGPRFLVPSQKGKGHYRVEIDPKRGPDWLCSCPDFELRKRPCKHIHAVKIVSQMEMKAGLSLPSNRSDRTTAKTTATRRTYKQDWTAYNAAQTTEKHRFQVLLSELCRGVPEPPYHGGRPPIPMADRIFACAFKVYSTVSGRRFSCDMRDAEAKGHASAAPHFNSVSRFLESADLTPILGGLIAESALPLRAVETDFAIDSSGFGSSRFVRWYDKKYGVVREEHDWVKVHLMCGVKTNIVTAIQVGHSYSADSPFFVPLVDATARRFTLNEVSADAAYCAYDNFEAVAKHGGRAYIAFKANTTGAGGGTYEKMFHVYNLNRDDYLAHYHKRSNVESTFSMVKAKFGDAVRSKTDTAMVNEALCKVLCHNLCRLIHSTIELGIEATFWRDEPEPTATPEVDGEAELFRMWEWM